MCKTNTNRANLQEEPKPFTLGNVCNKKVSLDFSALKLSSIWGGLRFWTTFRWKAGLESWIGWYPASRTRGTFHGRSFGRRDCEKRVYKIVAGYEDADDCDRLRYDAVMKMCRRLTGDDGSSLASQLNMSRFENGKSMRKLYNIDGVVEGLRKSCPVFVHLVYINSCIKVLRRLFRCFIISGGACNVIRSTVQMRPGLSAFLKIECYAWNLQIFAMVIYMYTLDHNPPHFHIQYGVYEAFVTLDCGIIAGR